MHVPAHVYRMGAQEITKVKIVLGSVCLLNAQSLSCFTIQLFPCGSSTCLAVRVEQIENDHVSRHHSLGPRSSLGTNGEPFVANGRKLDIQARGTPCLKEI